MLKTRKSITLSVAAVVLTTSLLTPSTASAWGRGGWGRGGWGRGAWGYGGGWGRGWSYRGGWGPRWGYGGYGGTWGYPGWGYGGGWGYPGWGYDAGGSYGGYGYGMGGMALGAAAIGAIAASTARRHRYNYGYVQTPVYLGEEDQAPLINSRSSRSKKGRGCYRTEWDALEGYVQVRVPC